MKIRKINILLAVFGAMIAFTGCKKDDGPIPNRVTIIDIPAITTTVDPSGSASIALASPATFAGKFKMDFYFPGATAPGKVDVVVRKSNGSAVNNNNVKIFQADITTLPATLTVTVAQIQALFGANIALNDNYDFAPDIFVNGTRYEAFPVSGQGTGAGVRAMPLYSEFARFRVQ